MKTTIQLHQMAKRMVIGVLPFYLFTFLPIKAQVTSASYALSDQQQIWHQSRNAAGMAFDFNTADSSANRGIAYFDYQHQDGDYHRVQDGGMKNNLRFFTERYQKVEKYLYGYGSFDFNMGRTKDRAWSDVLRSYNSNPFISGSSVFGKYDHQDFTLDASLSTIQLGHFTYGASIRYEVSDLSRLRDPRSRINLLDYRITPSITYSFRNGIPMISATHTLGLALHYDRRKEKLPSLTTVQTDPNLKYYVMTGLENATGTIGGYNAYTREYVNHEFGGELSYGFKGLWFKSLNTITLDRGTEYVYGQYKYEPGRYFNYRYGFSTQNRLNSGSMLHSIDAAVNYQQAYADEYRQERISTTDSITGYNSIRWNTTLEYRKRFQLKTLDFNFHYRLTFTEEQEQKGYVGLKYQLQNVSNKRLLPVSTLDYTSHFLALEGGVNIAGRLSVEALAGYNISPKADLNLANPTTDYAINVLIPDMNILDANYFRGHLQLEYQQPIRIAEKTTQWFARAYGDYLKADHSLKRSLVGVSIGLYY